MENESELNKAIQTYLGFGKNSMPLANKESVFEIYGKKKGCELVSEIERLVDEVNTYPIDWTSLDLNKAGEVIRVMLLTNHPKLTSISIDALVWQFTYSWR